MLSSVKGDYSEPIISAFRCAVYMVAPLEVRLQRIKQRALDKVDERVCAGGDMLCAGTCIFPLRRLPPAGRD